MTKYTIQCVSKRVDLPLPLINENCYVYNIFTTNHGWLVDIRSNLNLSLKLFFYSINNKLSLRPCLGEGNEMKWKGIKRLIVEYSSLPLFGSFNRRNGKSIPLFENLSRREWNK